MEEEQPRFRKVEAKKSKMHPGGLKDWVENEKWVDIRRKNKKGKFQPCGRNDTSKGKKPVCVPINKAKNLTEKEIKNKDLFPIELGKRSFVTILSKLY